MLDSDATQIGFAQLVGVSQPAIAKHVDRGLLPAGGTYRQWLVAYCEHLRDQAAGRGGDEQASLAKARADEAVMRTANLRLDYNAKLGSLIVAQDAAKAISEWCRFGNREYRQGVNNIVAEIQNAYNVKVDPEVINRVAEPTMERVKAYAEKLGRDLIGNSKQ